jgi:hypothetical protein
MQERVDSSEEEQDGQLEEEREGEDEAEEAGESGITLGLGSSQERRARDRQRRKAMKEEKRALKEKEDQEERVKVGEDTWVALEIAFHGDGWGESFKRRVSRVRRERRLMGSL